MTNRTDVDTAPVEQLVRCIPALLILPVICAGGAMRHLQKRSDIPCLFPEGFVITLRDTGGELPETTVWQTCWLEGEPFVRVYLNEIELDCGPDDPDGIPWMKESLGWERG